MHSKKNILSLLFILLLAFGSKAQSFVKEQSSLNFVITNMGMDVKGKFTDFIFTSKFVASDLTNSFLEAEIKVESIDTGIKARDKHLRNADYFEVATYPKITFRSEKIVKSGETFEAVGKLKMRGIEKQLTIPFSVLKKGDIQFLKATFKIDRTDFKVGETSFVMGEEVGITIICALK